MEGTRGLEYCSWDEIHKLAQDVAGKINEKYDCVLGVANGGIVPARLVAEELGIDCIMLIPVHKKQIVAEEVPRLAPGKRYLVIDDIYDTGDTYRKVAETLKGLDCRFAFCMSRYHQEFGVYGRLLNHDKWVVFPWEKS